MNLKQEYENLPYLEKLKVLMRKAQEEKDIWLMQTIQDEIDVTQSERQYHTKLEE